MASRLGDPRRISQQARERSERKNEDIFDKAKFLPKVTVVLDSLSPLRKVSFEKFDMEFYTRTKIRFEDAYTIFQEQEGRHWTMDKILHTLSRTCLKTSFTLEEDESGNVSFVLTPRSTPDTSQKSIPKTKTPEPAKPKEPEAPSIPPPQDFPVSTRVVRGKKEKKMEKRKETSQERADRMVVEEPKPIQWSEVHEMFSRPYWPWLNDNCRQMKRQKYSKFLDFAIKTTSNERDVKRLAKKLAEEFWSHYRFYGHILYLLQKLGTQTPDGFKINNVQKLLENQFPEEWRRVHPNLQLGNFLIKICDLVETNMIVRSDPDDPRMFKVNKIISYLGFHEIHDQELSMIYHYVASTSDPKTTQSIHTFLCDDYPEWAELYDSKTGQDRIWEICVTEPKMFAAEYDCVLAKSHLYKIPLPMRFSMFIVYTQNGN